jgi:hypothetical protein
MRLGRFLATVFVAVLLFGNTAAADELTFFATGDILTGFYTFDSSNSDTNELTNTLDNYLTPSPHSMTVKVREHTFSSITTSSASILLVQVVTDNFLASFPVRPMSSRSFGVVPVSVRVLFGLHLAVVDVSDVGRIGPPTKIGFDGDSQPAIQVPGYLAQ